MLIKTPQEIRLIRESAKILSQVHGHLAPYIKPGITTQELNNIAETYIATTPATPSFKGYQNYPATLCTSVNDQVVHGIPSNYTLQEGDIIAVDCGVCYKGYHSDSCYTYPVGNIQKKLLPLLSVGEKALNLGIQQAIASNRIGDIGYAIEQYVTANGFTVVKEYCGHGISNNLHEEPQVPNIGQQGQGIKLQPGMTLAIEPIINFGKADIKHTKDPWAVYTADGKPSAHFEHTILITHDKPEVLTNHKYIKQALQ